MKMKKLISSALVFVMLFTTVVAVIPINSFAEESAKYDISVKSEDAIDSAVLHDIFDDYRRYGSTFENKDGEIVKPFANAKELLEYERSKGYIDYAKYGNNAVYVNRYTGFMYFENGLTGQILTSNPIDPAYKTKENGVVDTISSPELSQIELHYFELANTSNKDDYDSYEWILENNQAPTVTATENGLDVEYILGTSLSSFTAPYALLYDSAIEKLIHPMFANFAALIESKCGPFDASLAAGLTSYSLLDQQLYKDEATDKVYNKTKIKDAITNLVNYVGAYDSKNGTSYKTVINNFASQMKSLLNYYTFVHPEKAGGNALLKDVVTGFAEGKAICILEGADSLEPTVTLTTLRLVDKAIKTVCPEFTLEVSNASVEESGYVPNTDTEKPSFRVTLSYAIDENGDLIVTIPANKISFPDTFCTIEYITPLKYFGCGDMSRDGYLFYPDGSGALVEFDDFYTVGRENMRLTLADKPVYGVDYCYAEIVGQQNRQQITMPVYGLVNEVNSTGIGYSKDKDTVTNGFFTVIEEGEALASLGYSSGGGIHKYIALYPTFEPFPTDKYDLSQTISVSGNTSYQVASSAKYSGNITMRITMLVDDAVYAEALSKDISYSGFAADYIGMACCYRSYLERNGIIDKLSESYSDIPLYIEALGSIDVTKKILSFPVTVSESLTSFEDVILMYKELSSASETLKRKAAENYDEAAKIEAGKHPELHQDEIDRYKALGDKYTQLSEYVTDIKNINFKLTGFANGGMHATYPAKLKWERSLGGKGGFNSLLEFAKGINATEGQSLGVYPDFDFMYIANTAMFDGISHRRISSKKVDNLFASKQVYDAVTQKYEKLFDLLVSSSSLGELYDKFEKQYSGFAATGISVSTLGSDINSNFDIDNPIDRESAKGHIADVLKRMADKYDIMIDTGNMYTLEYASHILNIPTDSSHYNVTSCTIPFVGLVLHGYVNYAGTPLNYSGSPDYEILRSIENGASLYYILCMENTNYLKEDENLSQYYGVDYNNLFENIVAQYKVLNDAIGDLQLYNIVDHKNIIAERIIDSDEMAVNYKNLMKEFAEVLETEIKTAIDLKIKAMRDNRQAGRGLVFDVSDEEFEAILKVASDRINLTVEELKDEFGFDKVIASVIEKYKSQYSSGAEKVTVSAEAMVNYRSAYAYITDSIATEEDYVHTDFTCDNGNVVMVTYEKEVDGKKDTVVFLLNYNIFSVKIKVDETVHSNFAEYADEDGYITIDKYNFVKIVDKEG